MQESRAGQKVSALGQYTGNVLAVLFAIAVTLAVVKYRNYFAAYDHFGYLSVLGLSFLANATVLLPAPSLVVVFTFGAVLSPTIVAIFGALGATLGELVGFLAGYGGRPLLRRANWTAKISLGMEKNSFSIIFLMALVPLPVFDVAGLIAGSLGIPLAQFATACYLGKLIKMLVFAFLGAGVLPSLQPIIENILQ